MNAFKFVLFGSGILLLSAAFVFTSDFAEDKQKSILPIAFCGGVYSNDANQSGKKHNDCHSPVTSYVDLLPPPSLMQGIGDSHLEITTQSDSAQKYFDQGLSLLHDFWDFEAYRAFKYATQLDSTAAMTHWGLAISLSRNSERDEERKRAIEKAKQFGKKASDHEQLYINALAAMDSIGAEKGQAIFRSGMEKLAHRYPNDPEAKLIIWLIVLDGGYDGNGDPLKDALYSQFMLEKLMREYPNHAGVHHYWIHQMENCCPDQALASADILASLTPKSGHMVHMPGHIYYRLGNYKKARASFIASMKVDSAYMAEQKIQQLDNWNYPHNLHYLVANCAEEGKYKEAAYWHKRLEDIPPPADSSKSRLKDYRGYVFLRKVIFGADLEMRFGLWDKMVVRYSKLLDSDSILLTDKSDKLYKNALLEYAKGMKAIELKKYDQARAAADAMDALLWRTLKQEMIDVWSGREKKLNALSLELRGNLASATGDYSTALKLLEQAGALEKDLGYTEPPPYARPIAESIAQAHITAKEFIKARETYQQMLKIRPNSGFALFGIARTYELEGEKSEAQKYYVQFKKVWSDADPTLAQIKKADQWLGANKN